jgi:thymidylate kinase
MPPPSPASPTRRPRADHVRGPARRGQDHPGRLLAQCLRHQGHTVATLPDLETLETEPIAATLTELLVSAGDPYLRTGDAVTNTLITAAIRADIVATVLDPTLSSAPNAVVIEDRGVHTMASYAIASLLREHRATATVSLGWIHALTTRAGPRQTRALWLRLPPDLAAHRAAGRTPSACTGRRPEHQAFLKWVNYAYELLADHDPQLTTLDVADHNAEQIHKAIHQALSRTDHAVDVGITACAARQDFVGNIS